MGDTLILARGVGGVEDLVVAFRDAVCHFRVKLPAHFRQLVGGCTKGLLLGMGLPLGMGLTSGHRSITAWNGLIFKAHSLFFLSNLGVKVLKKKKRSGLVGEAGKTSRDAQHSRRAAELLEARNAGLSIAFVQGGNER